jgi:hypothetical protein
MEQSHILILQEIPIVAIVNFMEESALELPYARYLPLGIIRRLRHALKLCPFYGENDLMNGVHEIGIIMEP